MKKSYSQLGQDLIASYFFKHHAPISRKFIDIGAFDGVNYSNTRLFFEQGWCGVCVEPVLKNYLKLEQLYLNTCVFTVRTAAADFHGEMILNVATIPWAETWGSDVSSPAEDVLKHWPGYVWEKETVPVMTANEILEQNNINEVDYVSIDVEGQEMAVLFGFDLNKYNPKLIIVEYSTASERIEIIHYLQQFGYFCWLDNRQDLFMVKGKRRDYWRIILNSILTGKQSLLNYFQKCFLTK